MVTTSWVCTHLKNTKIHKLTHWLLGEIRIEWHSRKVILNQANLRYGWLDLTLVQIMACCCQAMATSHFLGQCSPISMSPYGITRPQWVNKLSLLSLPKFFVNIFQAWYHKMLLLPRKYISKYCLQSSNYFHQTSICHKLITSVSLWSDEAGSWWMKLPHHIHIYNHNYVNDYSELSPFCDQAPSEIYRQKVCFCVGDLSGKWTTRQTGTKCKSCTVSFVTWAPWCLSLQFKCLSKSYPG